MTGTAEAMTAALTDAQAAQLREAAEQATPGPWYYKRTDDEQREILSEGKHVAIVQVQQSEGQRVANAAYIALANPATILALLDERKEWLAAERRDRMRGRRPRQDVHAGR